MKSTECSATEPRLAVGIVTAEKVTVRPLEGFASTEPIVMTAELLRSLHPSGRMMVAPKEGFAGVFEIDDVVIGIGFHWQQRETQRFTGAFELIADGYKVVVVNHVDVEDYLKSVISSEMSATASEEFLRAHAVISRSWVMRKIADRKRRNSRESRESRSAENGPDTLIRWYENDDHTLFDVCADDHCQRYQGITRQTTAKASRAVDTTRGEVLMYEGEICDARFSKCCGGVMERFSTCWADEEHPYLAPRRDAPTPLPVPDLTEEAAARQWIMGSDPESFCNCNDATILAQVLNNYDQTTTDFYRWSVSYDAAALGRLIREKSGYDLGDILALEPLQRGPSGRIMRLRITGAKRSMTIGKELEIRRWLSPSHLYSSAFVVEKRSPVDEASGATSFTLHGAGWGHGVGLCQIGAAVMAERGYTYRQILAHYYPSSTLTRFSC